MRDLLLVLPDDVRPRLALEQQLRSIIRDGQITAGHRLPSTRSLAADLGIARSTVVAAYEQLAVEGYVLARQGKATVVADVLTATAPTADRNPMGMPPPHDFRPGEPETGSFPRREWMRSTRRVLVEAPDDVFGYCDPRGRAELREALAHYLARSRTVSVDRSALRVYAGFASTLGFLGEAFRREGIQRVAVEDPMLPFHRSILELSGVETIPLSVDGDGIQVGRLVDANVGAVMVTPANHQPLGVTLSSERRQALVDWAREADAWIIEDDYDGEFRYDRRPIGALQGLAPDRVVYAGTASKALAPGVHLSWLVVPPGLRRSLAEVTQLRAGVSTINQLTLGDFITSGAYDRHVRQQRRTYRRRQTELLQDLQTIDWIDIAAPTAGMHLVAYILSDSHVQEPAVLKRATDVGVGLTGLQTHFGHSKAGLIINVSRPPAHGLVAATDALLSVLRSFSR